MLSNIILIMIRPMQRGGQYFEIFRYLAASLSIVAVAERSAMKEKLNYFALICFFSCINLTFANSFVSYYVTILTDDIQDSQSTTTKETSNYLQYKNTSVHTSFIELSRNSDLAQVISAVSSISSRRHTTENGEDVLHLSKW